MRFDILTLFPDMLRGPLETSILKRAQNAGLLEVQLHDIRDSATGVHRQVDDTPYGGGAGMVLKVDILVDALDKVLSDPQVAAVPPKRRRIILLTPQGKRFNQPRAHYLAESYDQVTLICGHYEGFDERIRSMVDSQISLGDFVLTGGELPALVIVDAVARLLPEVIKKESPEEESFSLRDAFGSALLEYPHYTRPLTFRDETVPEVLLSGNHAQIAAWRLERAQERTSQAQKDEHQLEV